MNGGQTLESILQVCIRTSMIGLPKVLPVKGRPRGNVSESIGLVLSSKDARSWANLAASAKARCLWRKEFIQCPI